MGGQHLVLGEVDLLARRQNHPQSPVAQRVPHIGEVADRVVVVDNGQVVGTEHVSPSVPVVAGGTTDAIDAAVQTRRPPSGAERGRRELRGPPGGPRGGGVCPPGLSAGRIRVALVSRVPPRTAVLLAACVLLPMLTAASCGDQPSGVSLGAARLGTVDEIVEAPGSVTARAAATVSASADGTLDDLRV